MKLKAYIATLITFGISEIVAIYLIYTLDDLKLLYFRDAPPGCGRQHYVPTTICMIILNGHAMCIFRLLPGIRTRTLKHIHAILHILSAWGGWKAVLWIHEQRQSGNKEPYGKYGCPSTTHMWVSPKVYATVLIQIISAIFVNYYMYPNQRRRRLFAQFHNFFGLFVFNAVCAVPQIILQSNAGKEKYQYDKSRNCALAIYTYMLLIDAILLNPHAEWQIIGPI